MGLVVLGLTHRARRLLRPQVPPVAARRRRHSAVFQERQGARLEQQAHLRALLGRDQAWQEIPDRARARQRLNVRCSLSSCLVRWSVR